MLRPLALAGLVLFGLVAAARPSEAYWVRGYYGPVFVRPYYRPLYVRPRIVVLPPPPSVVVRPAPVVVAPYPYYRAP